MAQNGYRILLNEAQKNSLAVTMRLLEDQIFTLKMLMSGQEQNRVLSYFENDLSVEENRNVEIALNQLLLLLKKLKRNSICGRKEQYSVLI